jgi:hypothetical protein
VTQGSCFTQVSMNQVQLIGIGTALQCQGVSPEDYWIFSTWFLQVTGSSVHIADTERATRLVTVIPVR